MRATASMLAILLAGCGGNGGGNDDTSTDSPEDTLDTQGDTSPDSVPDTAEDTTVDTALDTFPDTIEDTAGDTIGDTIEDTIEDSAVDTTGDTAVDAAPDTAEDTPLDTAEDTLADTTADTPADTYTDEVVEEEAPECTLDDDCDNGIYCDGEETCSAGGTCQDGTLVTCDDTDPCTTDRCNEDDDGCTFDPTDGDGDGFAAATGPGGETCPGTDCDDTDNAIFPGALPVACSGADHDCDGFPDDDRDGDGHVDIACTGGEDCNDGDAASWSGCWYDPVTGYRWEDPPAGGGRNWADSVAYCASLSLAGFGAGEWHLPTIEELRSLVRGCTGTVTGGACGVTDSCLGASCSSADCSSCTVYGGPGGGGCYWSPGVEGTCSSTWSSSTYADDVTRVWRLNFGRAEVGHDPKTDGNILRCVNP